MPVAAHNALCAALPRFSTKILLSTAGSKFPPRLGNRKNYLRRKILKIATPTPRDPVVPATCPEPKEAALEPYSEQITEEIAKESDRKEAFHVSEESISSSGALETSRRATKMSAKSILEYGCYFILFFVFHKILAAFVTGDGNPEQKGRNVESLDNKSSSTAFGPISDNMLPWNEFEMEKKIEEIKKMAREARKIEEEESREDGSVEETDGRITIAKEIDARLNRLKQSVNLPASYMNFLDKLKDSDQAKSCKSKYSTLSGNEVDNLQKEDTENMDSPQSNSENVNETEDEESNGRHGDDLH